jgi:hypothetical protein
MLYAQQKKNPLTSNTWSFYKSIDIANATLSLSSRTQLSHANVPTGTTHPEVYIDAVAGCCDMPVELITGKVDPNNSILLHTNQYRYQENENYLIEEGFNCQNLQFNFQIENSRIFDRNSEWERIYEVLQDNPNFRLPSKDFKGFKDVVPIKGKGIPASELIIRDREDTDCQPDQTLESEPYFSSETDEFLDTHSFLKPIFSEAPDKIKKFFPDAEIEYELTTDPEVENWVTLEIMILTHISAEKAFEQMKKLKKDWWLQAYVESDRKLRLDVVFI